ATRTDFPRQSVVGAEALCGRSAKATDGGSLLALRFVRAAISSSYGCAERARTFRSAGYRTCVAPRALRSIYAAPCRASTLCAASTTAANQQCGLAKIAR